MSVFAVAVVLLLLLQLLALSWPARSVRAGVLALAGFAGAYASTGLAFGLQWLTNRTIAWVTGEPLAAVVERAGHSYDPLLEEFAKLVPLLALLAAASGVRRQWGFTDLLVISAALGAGFGFVEVVAVHPTATELAAIGGGAVGSGIGPIAVIAAHAGFAALAGLGVGVVVRARTPIRWAGPLLFLLSVGLHVRVNLTATRPGHPLAADWIAIAGWLIPLLGFAIALWVDVRGVRAGKRARPDLLLAAERTGASSVRAIVDLAGLRAPYSALVVARYVRLRRSVYYAGADVAPAATGVPGPAGTPAAHRNGPSAAHRTGHPGLSAVPRDDHRTGRREGTDPGRADQLWRLARSIRADLDAADQAEAWRRLEPRRLRELARVAGAPPFPLGRGTVVATRVIAVAVALPVLLFVFAGSIPAFAGVRRAMVTDGGTFAALLTTLVGVGFLLWWSIRLVRTCRLAAGYPLADSIALLRLALTGAVGTTATAAALVVALGVGLSGSVGEPVPGVHLHLMAVLPRAPVELLSWLVLGFLPVAAVGVAPPAAVPSAAVGPLGSTMLRLAGDRGRAVAGGAEPVPPPVRLDRSMRELRPSEQRTALLLAQQERFRGRTFRRPDSWSPAAMHVDWVDDAGGRYDAYGGWAPASSDGDLRRFLDRLDMHLVRDVDYTVIDLTGFARWQVAVVAAHLENPPPAVREHLHKVVRVGF